MNFYDISPGILYIVNERFLIAKHFIILENIVHVPNSMMNISLNYSLTPKLLYAERYAYLLQGKVDRDTKRGNIYRI